MWRGTEEILSDKRAQTKKNKITNHVNVCGTDVGDVPRCILTGSTLSSKGCVTPEEGGDAMLEHGSRCVSDSSCFFYCCGICYHNPSILYTFDFHPASPAAQPCVWWHPLWRGMTSPARDHVNLVGCHVPRDTYFMAFQAHETCMLAAKVKFNRVSA